MQQVCWEAAISSIPCLPDTRVRLSVRHIRETCTGLAAPPETLISLMILWAYGIFWLSLKGNYFVRKP